MLRFVVETALRHRVVVIVVALALMGLSLDAFRRLPVDAFPDVTNVQVQVATVVPGRSPDEVERLATIPIEIAMTGLPGMVEMRSQNEAGLSIITLVFTDDTPVYFARQLVGERLDEVRTRLPDGVSPVLGPVATALSEIYQYTLERPDDGERALTREELKYRRMVQDWVVRPLLRSVPGVAEINSTGGFVRQYQVLVDPVKMRYYGVTIADVHRALSRNNENTSGGILPQGPEILLVRGLGLIRGLDDIRSIVIKEHRNTPVYLRDLAEVRIGEEVRYGAMLKGGYTEAVGGIVSMIAGGNAKEITTRIKERVRQINENNMLPGGLRIVPYYDRSELVDAALNTIARVLQEGIVLVIVVLFLFLGDLRSSLIVIATLVLTPAVTFLVMERAGMSANLMSLGGAGDSDRADGGWFGGGGGECVRAAQPPAAGAEGAGDSGVGSGSGRAGDFRHFRDHSGFSAADDARRNGGEAVCAAGAYDCDCAGDFVVPVAGAVAGALFIFPERRQRA